MIAFAVASIGPACSGSGRPPPDRADARRRLEVLGTRWFASSTTITYRTTERDAGGATSPHQCLRRLVEVDVQTGLRICSGVGQMRLAWERSERWRMDAASPRGTFTLLSTSDGAVRCRSDGTVTGCVAVDELGSFASLVEDPMQILDELGAKGGAVPVTVEASRTIAGMRAGCFRATGGSAEAVRRVEWCYSRDGILLSLFDGVEGGRVTTAEATDVSGGVADGVFVPPST